MLRIASAFLFVDKRFEISNLCLIKNMAELLIWQRFYNYFLPSEGNFAFSLIMV